MKNFILPFLFMCVFSCKGQSFHSVENGSIVRQTPIYIGSSYENDTIIITKEYVLQARNQYLNYKEYFIHLPRKITPEFISFMKSFEGISKVELSRDEYSIEIQVAKFYLIQNKELEVIEKALNQYFK